MSTLYFPDDFDAGALSALTRDFLLAEFERAFWQERRRALITALKKDGDLLHYEAAVEADRMRQTFWEAWLCGVTWLNDRHGRAIGAAVPEKKGRVR